MRRSAIASIKTALQASAAQNAPHDPFTFGTVTNVSVSGARVQMGNESTPRIKFYQWLGGNNPSVGDRVMLAWDNGTYVILGSVPGFQGGSHYTGEIITGGWVVAPPGTVDCDGAAYSRTALVTVKLFGAIGTQFGVGDGSTTFNVPNYMAGAGDVQRFPLGGVTIGSKGGSSAHNHNDGVHNHQLNGTGFAAMSIQTTLIRALISSGLSWVANNQSTIPTVVAGSGQTTGAQLLGATNNSDGLSVTSTNNQYNPWQGARVVIKL